MLGSPEWQDQEGTSDVLSGVLSSEDQVSLPKSSWPSLAGTTSTPSRRREAAKAEWGWLEPRTLDSRPHRPLLPGLHPGPRAAHRARCLVNAPCPPFGGTPSLSSSVPTSWPPSSVWSTSPLLARDRWTWDPFRADCAMMRPEKVPDQCG